MEEWLPLLTADERRRLYGLRQHRMVGFTMQQTKNRTYFFDIRLNDNSVEVIKLSTQSSDTPEAKRILEGRVRRLRRRLRHRPMRTGVRFIGD